jgi:hypothetical protein
LRRYEGDEYGLVDFSQNMSSTIARRSEADFGGGVGSAIEFPKKPQRRRRANKQLTNNIAIKQINVACFAII